MGWGGEEREREEEEEEERGREGREGGERGAYRGSSKPISSPHFLHQTINILNYFWFIYFSFYSCFLPNFGKDKKNKEKEEERKNIHTTPLSF